MAALAHFASSAVASLASAILLSTLLVFCVAVTLRLLPGISAAARSLLWSVVFLLTFVLPLVHSTRSVATTGTPHLVMESAWAYAIVALWALFSLTRSVCLCHSALQLYRVASRATPIVPPAEMAGLLANAGVKVRLCASTEVCVPSLAGFLHPCILLPTALLATISPAELYPIILHELEHLRRRDSWTNLLQKLALVLFPLNPALLWVERRLCLERELACDDHVLEVTNGAAKAYAICLANLAEASLVRRSLSLALGAWHRQSELASRIHRILLGTSRNMSRSQAVAAAALVLAATLGTAVLAAKSPQIILFTHVPRLQAAMSSTSITPSIHRTFVEAALPRPGTTLTAISMRRKHIHRSRIVAAQTRRRATAPDFVLIGWQRDQVSIRWAAPPGFRLTYAAVPNRTGWFVLQL